MQSILICTNSHLGISGLITVLSKKFKMKEEIVCNYLYKRGEHFRTNPQIHEIVKAIDFKTKGISEEEYREKIKQGAFVYNEDDNYYKIIEIEDGIKWEIRDWDCAVGEYICEKHRTWS